MREMIYLWLFGALVVLIPKKRGKGFLKTPMYHNYTPESEEISKVSNCDVFGLDGYLEFECGTDITTYKETRKEFLERITPVLERIYSCQMREALTQDEFFSLIK